MCCAGLFSKWEYFRNGAGRPELVAELVENTSS
jgi:hypothetical protein